MSLDLSERIKHLRLKTDFLHDLRRYEESLLTIQNAIALDTDNAELYCELAFSYRALGRYEQGKQAANTAVRLAPELAWAHNEMALIALRLDEFDIASHHAQQTLRIAPDAAITYEVVAEVYQWKDDLKKAYEYAKKGIEIDPELTHLHYIAGSICLELNNLKAGEHHFRAALALDAEDADHLYALSMVMFLQYQFIESARLIYSAIKIDPSDSDWVTEFVICVILYANTHPFKSTKRIKKSLGPALWDFYVLASKQEDMHMDNFEELQIGAILALLFSAVIFVVSLFTSLSFQQSILLVIISSFVLIALSRYAFILFIKWQLRVQN